MIIINKKRETVVVLKVGRGQIQIFDGKSFHVWNSTLFDGTVVQANSYGVTMKMLSRIDGKSFNVTNIYGPSHSPEKLGFVTWLMNLDTSKFKD